MLVCRACNTRYGDGMRVCPSCGRRASGSMESAAGDSGPLPPTPASLDDEIDLDEDSVVGGRASSSSDSSGSDSSSGSSGSNSSSGSSSGSGGSRSSRGSSGSSGSASKGRSRTRSVAPPPAAGPSGIETSLEQVKALLAEQPGLLEKGLGLYADEEGEPLGIDFPTPVGSIDLLGRDRKGGFVVVHLPSANEADESVSAMLRRMGWVRKHLAGGGEEVRGVVVLEQLPEELAYAAAGAAGSISFKGYQLTLSFHDLEE